MQLIDHNGTIHLRFHSAHKLVTRSLGLPHTEQNLAYVQKTLLPIFHKLADTKRLFEPTLRQNSPNFASFLARPSHANHAKLKFRIQSTTIPRRPHLLSHFCAIYLADLRTRTKATTLRTAISAINRLFDFLPDYHVRTYAPSDIYSAISTMRGADLSNQSINQILSYAKIAFKLARSHGAIAKNPFELVRNLPATPKSKFCFTKSQISALLTRSTGELRTFLFVAFFTGARSGEILGLCKEDFDFKADKITISKNQTRFELTTPKNGKPRTINLLKPLKEHILGLDLPSGRIFASDYFALLYQFKKLLKSLDLPPCGLHSTRHSFASHLLGANLAPTLIAHTLGHSNLDMINRVYGHFLPNPTDLRKLNQAMKL